MEGKKYRNIFAELGYAGDEINRRIEECRYAIFEGPDRFYFEGPQGTGYFTDTGNNDVRTEGMSYGMMMAVQLDRRDIFDRLWKWALTYMRMAQGKYQGYFAWSCGLDGTKNAWGPAPDGEEYFAMALFFASARWGDGEGLYNYAVQARELLALCLHHGSPMWEPSNHLIKFVPDCDFSDPSYHLPHFYELFGDRAVPADRPFWKEAARASREYIALCCHQHTGLAPEYAAYDGKPNPAGPPADHGDFYSDAYRVALNVGLDALWFGSVPELSAAMGRLLCFFAPQDSGDLRRYTIDGTPLEEKALHPVGLIAANAAAAPAVLGAGGRTAEDEAAAEKAVRLFWNTPPRTGPRRYYDNCLYFFSLLVLSGQYRIY
jgi:oligosaccharide reducing-end xylanase